MKRRSDMGITLSGTFKRESDSGLAVLVEMFVAGVQVDQWIPKSVIDDSEDPDDWVEGEDIDFEIRTWFARKEGLDV
jgi:hypothetical protein